MVQIGSLKKYIFIFDNNMKEQNCEVDFKDVEVVSESCVFILSFMKKNEINKFVIYI